MPLSDAQIDRFARQIILPGVGAAGQARLLEARVAVCGTAKGARHAVRYLRAGGLQVCATDAEPTPEFAIIAGTLGAECDGARVLHARGTTIVWYETDGRRIRSGVASPDREFPIARNRSAESAAADDEPLHAVAACDAVNTLIAVILAWPEAEWTGEVELA